MENNALKKDVAHRILFRPRPGSYECDGPYFTFVSKSIDGGEVIFKKLYFRRSKLVIIVDVPADGEMWYSYHLDGVQYVDEIHIRSLEDIPSNYDLSY